MNLYVGNLAWSTTDAELRQAFAEFGEVRSARVIFDRESGRSRGFAFVRMPSADAADSALSLDGTELEGRRLSVSKGREKSLRRSR